jgi:hypothetical protein
LSCGTGVTHPLDTGLTEIRAGGGKVANCCPIQMKKSIGIAHFALDFLRKESVCVRAAK